MNTAHVLAAEVADKQSGEPFFFWLLAVVSVLAALGMIFARKAVHSALLLATVMLCLAALYAIQNAPFLAFVQVIVYTGAVLMLFLFVLMLVGVSSTDSLVETIRGQRFWAVIAAVGFIVLLAVGLGNASLGDSAGLNQANSEGNVIGLARLLFSLAYVEAGALRLMSRNSRDVTLAYPELYPMAGAVGGRDLVLDGEIVAFDDSGRPSFGALAMRMHQRRPMRIAELVKTVPVTYMIFDVLHVGDHSTVRLPYDERRELLEGLVRPGFRWQTPVAFLGDPRAALEASGRLGLEGVVVKRRDSPYRPGRRGPEWTKVKNFLTLEVVVGGWKPGAGRRAGGIGSLLLGTAWASCCTPPHGT